MANRHKKKAGGVVYSGAGSNTEKEAKERKFGGRTKSAGKVCGGKSMPRLDKRARGGRIGGGGDCTKSPFSAAHVKTNGDA